jgi:hypothetical protein
LFVIIFTPPCLPYTVVVICFICAQVSKAQPALPPVQNQAKSPAKSASPVKSPVSSPAKSPVAANSGQAQRSANSATRVSPIRRALSKVTRSQSVEGIAATSEANDLSCLEFTDRVTISNAGSAPLSPSRIQDGSLFPKAAVRTLPLP